MSDRKISNAVVFPVPTPPLNADTKFAAELAGAQVGPLLSQIAVFTSTAILGAQGPGANGTAGQVLTAAGGTSAAVWSGTSNPVGTYHDATSSRALTTVYTNSHAVPIWLAISVNITSGSVALTAEGFQVDSVTGAGFWTLQGFVGAGGTYELTDTGVAAITAWYERY